DTVHLGSVNEDAGRVDRRAFIQRAPRPDSVEVFHREADGFEDLMAGIARRIRVMRFHDLPHRRRLQVARTIGSLFFDRRNVWWRLRCWDSKERQQEPCAALYWRGSSCV